MAKFQITRGIYISHDLQKERKIIMTCSAVDRSYMYLSKVDNRYKFKGANWYFSLSAGNNNAAYRRLTSQSSEIHSSSFATDGSRYNSPSEKCSLTTSEKDPWWMVDLERDILVRDVYVFVYYELQRNFLLEIRIGNHGGASLQENPLCDVPFRLRNSNWQRTRCPVPLRGRYVSIMRIVDDGRLQLCEVEVREEG